MACETRWMHNRIATCAAALLTGAALVAGGMAVAPGGAVATEGAEASVETTATGATVGVVVSGSYDASEDTLQGLLDTANQAREEQGLSPLAWSSSLATLAQERAAELAFNTSIGHERLDGSGSVVGTIEGGITVVGECASWGTVSTGDAAATLAAAWVAQGAEAADLTNAPEYMALVSADAATAGFACFTVGDTIYVVAELGGAEDPETPVVDTGLYDGAANITVQIPTGSVATTVTGPGTLETGATSIATFAVTNLSGAPLRLASTPVWSSSNEAVASVDATSGAITAHGAGETTLALSVDGVTLGSTLLTVSEAQPVEPADVDAQEGGTEEGGEQPDDPASTPNPGMNNDAPDIENGDGPTDESDGSNEDNNDLEEGGDNAEGDGGNSSDGDTGSETSANDEGQSSDGNGDQTDGADGQTDDTDDQADATDNQGSDGENQTDGEDPDTIDNQGSDTVDPDIVTVLSFENPPTLYVADDGSSWEPAGTIKVTFPDGTDGTIVPTWVYPETLAPASDGVLQLTCPVRVGDAEQQVVQAIQYVSSPAETIELTCTVGDTIALPATATLSYHQSASGGNEAEDATISFEAPVTWDALPEGAHEQAGTFTVNGAIPGNLAPITATVTVIEPETEAPELVATAIAPTEVTTTVGTAPVLPATVSVTWSDDSVTDEAVTWEEIDAAQYATVGEFVVTGTIEADAAARATCTVKVEAAPATPVKVDALPDVQTAAGSAPTLPANVNVVYSDETVQAHTVTWDAIDAAQYHNGGSFTVSGTVDGTDLTAAVKVVVADAYVTGVQNNLSVETTAGTAPNLPKTASIRWSNGDTSNEKVSWNTVDASQYANPGSFTATGTVQGHTVNCSVTVKAKAAQIATTGDETNIVPVVAGVVAGVALVGAAVALILKGRKK